MKEGISGLIAIHIGIIILNKNIAMLFLGKA